MPGYARAAPGLRAGLRYADDRAQDKNSRRRRRSAAARPAAAVLERTGLRRAHGLGRPGHGQAPFARARRPAGARSDAPRGGRPVDLPAPSRGQEHRPHHHADRQRRGRRSHRRARDGGGRLPAQAVQPARVGGAHQRRAPAARGPAAARGARGRAGKGQFRQHDGRPRHPHARPRRPVDLAHHGRVRAPQGPGHESANAAVSRQADGARARARIRGIRPLDRRPGLPPAQARREGPRASRLYSDRLGLRLRVRAGRRAAVSLRLWPRSLLWRTFLLLAALVVATTVGYFQIFRAYEVEPRARQISQNLISIVNLTRSALVNSQPELRRELLSDLAEREGIQVYPSEPDERLAPPADEAVLNLARELVRRQLGEGTRFASERDGKPGLWLSFHIADDEYWLRIPRGRLERQIALRWLGWGALALALSLLAAYFIVSRLNRPLRALATAAAAIGKGKTPEPLSESGPEEIGTLSHAFNEMSRDLARLDADRALILAGVSHDLRTPLSRLRLGLEMSGAEPQLKDGMTADIEEMDRIINQFLDFARTDGGEAAQDADLAAIAAEVAEHYRRHGRAVATDLASVPRLPLQTMAMRRVVLNLVDNALRYGEKDVGIAVRAQDHAVVLEVADRGPGIPVAEVERLKRPFTRLEAARSDKGGAGLGLAIVERVVRAHRGSFDLLPRPGGGLLAEIRLPAA